LGTRRTADPRVRAVGRIRGVVVRLRFARERNAGMELRSALARSAERRAASRVRPAAPRGEGCDARLVESAHTLTAPGDSRPRRPLGPFPACRSRVARFVTRGEATETPPSPLPATFATAIAPRSSRDATRGRAA